MSELGPVVEVMRSAVADGNAPLLVTNDTIKGVTVADFPATSRPTDTHNRLGLLTRFRLAVGELAFRPDLRFETHVRRVQAPGDHTDEDLFVDVVAWTDEGEMGGPLAALGCFGMHRSSLGSVDPDPLYASQRLMVVAPGLGTDGLEAFRARLSARIDAVNVALPSSDVRQELSALRYRVFRELLFAQMNAGLLAPA